MSAKEGIVHNNQGYVVRDVLGNSSCILAIFRPQFKSLGCCSNNSCSSHVPDDSKLWDYERKSRWKKNQLPTDDRLNLKTTSPSLSRRFGFPPLSSTLLGTSILFFDFLLFKTLAFFATWIMRDCWTNQKLASINTQHSTWRTNINNDKQNERERERERAQIIQSKYSSLQETTTSTESKSSNKSRILPTMQSTPNTYNKYSSCNIVY
ncbi:hypothetical protein C0J52_24323 [Blattella germanica]|nr:hypothetical protein C0J52_24323 [Blattella germanica]